MKDLGVKDYGILFCFAFVSFLIYSIYSLLSIIVIGDISYFSGIVLLFTMISSIYFVIKYQSINNKIIIKEKKKVVKRNKIYNMNKRYNYEFKEKKTF